MSIYTKLKQVQLELSMEEFLRKFYDMWYSDAAELTKALGFETEDEYYDRLNGIIRLGEDPRLKIIAQSTNKDIITVEDLDKLPDFFEDCAASGVASFSTMKSAYDNNDFSGITIGQVKELRDVISKALDTTPIDDSTFKKKVLAFMDNFQMFSSSKSAKSDSQLSIVKSVQDEQRRALFVVLEPNEGEFTNDVQGDGYSAETIEKGCISFNTHCNVAGLFHRIELEDQLAVIEQSFINPANFFLDDGRMVQKGAWLQWWAFPAPAEDQEDLIWPKVKSGEFNGVSIKCDAMGYEIND